MNISRGATILMPTPTQRDRAKKHLFVVMCAPIDDYVLVVPIATCREKYDVTCILQAGDHPFIKTLSYAAYYFAECKLVQHLQSDVAKNIAKLREPISEKVFTKILNGFYRSKYTRNFVFEYLEPRA